MKRITLFVALIVVAAAALPAADLLLGPNVYYASAIEPADIREARPDRIVASDFALGAETRLYLRAIQGSAVAVFTPGSSFRAPRLRVMTDIGLSLKLAFLRAGIGMGPDFGIAFGETTEAGRLGGNIRLTGDIELGDLSIGLSWYSLISFDRASIAEAFRNPYGFLGLTVLKKL